MEEERARQGGDAEATNTASASSAAPVMMDTEDDELARAIAMSIQDSQPDDEKAKTKSPKKKVTIHTH